MKENTVEYWIKRIADKDIRDFYLNSPGYKHLMGYESSTLKYALGWEGSTSDTAKGDQYYRQSHTIILLDKPYMDIYQVKNEDISRKEFIELMSIAVPRKSAPAGTSKYYQVSNGYWEASNSIFNHVPLISISDWKTLLGIKDVVDLVVKTGITSHKSNINEPIVSKINVSIQRGQRSPGIIISGRGKEARPCFKYYSHKKAISC